MSGKIFQIICFFWPLSKTDEIATVSITFKHKQESLLDTNRNVFITAISLHDLAFAVLHTSFKNTIVFLNTDTACLFSLRDSQVMEKEKI